MSARPNMSNDPTPQEIAKACAEVRSNWSEKERRLRSRMWGNEPETSPETADDSSLSLHLHNLMLLKQFLGEHGWENLEQKTVVDRVRIGVWVKQLRTEYKRGGLAEWLVDELETIPGWIWKDRMVQ